MDGSNLAAISAAQPLQEEASSGQHLVGLIVSKKVVE
jgi:hypothetical protein